MPKHSEGMAYTRQKYIRSIPQSKIKIFTIGDQKGDYSYAVLLRAPNPSEVSSDALEAARITANKMLETSGKSYLLKVLVYPHEIVREHKFMGFAGADRLSQGMSRAFGRPKSRSAKIVANQPIMVIYTKGDAVDLAKTALKRASKKLSILTNVVIEEVEEAKT